MHILVQCWYRKNFSVTALKKNTFIPLIPQKVANNLDVVLLFTCLLLHLLLRPYTWQVRCCYHPLYSSCKHLFLHKRKVFYSDLQLHNAETHSFSLTCLLKENIAMPTIYKVMWGLYSSPCELERTDEGYKKKAKHRYQQRIEGRLQTTFGEALKP